MGAGLDGLTVLGDTVMGREAVPMPWVPEWDGSWTTAVGVAARTVPRDCAGFGSMGVDGG